MVLFRDDGGATTPFPFLKAPSLDCGVDVEFGCIGGCSGGIALHQPLAMSIWFMFLSCSVRLLRGCAMATEVSCGAQCGLLQPLPWYTWLTFVNPGSWGTTSPAAAEKVVASYGDEDRFHYAQVVHHAGVDLSLLLSHCCFPQVRCLSGAGCFGGRRP